MSTDRLYYRDCYLSNFKAQVVEKADMGRRIYLDSTAFYPTSGGQPHDTGILGGQTVLEVMDEEDRIAHVLAEPAEGDLLEGTIDWSRRYDHMQQHTGQHLLSAVLVELFSAQTLSFHMGAEVSSIELSVNELTDAQIDKAERRANEIVWQARPVSIHYEDAEAAQGLRKASARSGILRIIEIGELDRSACGGTHVRSTAELGPILMVGRERIRGNIRVEFVCGGRALRYAKNEHHTLAELSRIASTAVEKLPDYLSNLKNRSAEFEKAQQRLASELARRDGEQAHRDAAVDADGIRRWLLAVPALDDVVRAKAQAFTKLGKAIVLVTGADPKGVLIASSSDSGVNAGATLKDVLSRAGARGGGSATLAQGSPPDDSTLEFLKKELGFRLS